MNALVPFRQPGGIADAALGLAFTPDPALAIGAVARRCLDLELDTWPKPGLVSHRDAGSHADMDAGTFRRSSAALEPYFAALARCGAHDGGMDKLRAIGIDAEAAMLQSTGRVNTHRGAIFGLGLLCAAAGFCAARGGADQRLGTIVARRWGTVIGASASDPQSHGTLARRRYGAAGARGQAVAGFPALYEAGLPNLALARGAMPGDPEAARVQVCFALIATVDDTNLLHRGGSAGWTFAREAATAFLRNGGVAQTRWRDAAEAVHRAFVARRLSPGGSADLLAMTLFVDAIERPGRERAR